MHDIKNIKKNPESFDDSMKKRHTTYRSSDVLALENKSRMLVAQVQDLQEKRNTLAKKNACTEKNSREQVRIIEEGKQIKQDMALLSEKCLKAQNKLRDVLLNIPNVLDNNIPEGLTENSNKIIREWGQKRIFDFSPKCHLDIGEKLGMLDTKSSVKISGSRFAFFTHGIARLERALINFMLDRHTNKHGYVEVSPPVLVTEETMLRVGQLPKFAEDSFKTTEGLRLIPTAEVPLVGSMSNKIIQEQDLPIRLAAHTPCFRSEAGSAGRDTKGIFRLHQFSKVELVSVVLPEESSKELEKIVKIGEKILQELQIPYRIVLLCAGDTGFCARKTYDIEAWLPTQLKYREISSCSNCGDFQSIRMNSRYKSLRDGKNRPPHTLNGSSLAVGRTMIAIMENYQDADGSVTIPEALRSYMGNCKKIEKK
jgi:seryl-tRNA synthetase